MINKHLALGRSPLHGFNWYAPRPETLEVRVGEQAKNYVVLYATDGETAFTQRINLTDKEVYVGEAPLDTSVPWQGSGLPLAIVGSYQHTARTKAFSDEIWQERFG
jgi:hypothetical protein